MSQKSLCRSGSQTLFFGGREATTGNTSAVRRLEKSEMTRDGDEKEDSTMWKVTSQDVFLACKIVAMRCM